MQFRLSNSQRYLVNANPDTKHVALGQSTHQTRRASVATVVTRNWSSWCSPLTACAGRCSHAVASVGGRSGARRRDSYLVIAAVHCSPNTSCCCEFGVRRALVHDIVRYLVAAIIAGLPHPRSISRYRLIDKNPSHTWTPLDSPWQNFGVQTPWHPWWMRLCSWGKRWSLGNVFFMLFWF